MRIDPPPSLPCATGCIPEATAQAQPPLEPPAVCSRVPGISRGRTEAALGGRTQAEFGGGRFAEQNSTGVGEPHGEFRVGGRVPILVVLRAEGGADIPGPEQILERIRDAEQRQHGRIRSVQLFEPRCVRERALGGDGHECAEPGIQLLDAREKKFRDLARADFLFEDKLAQFVCLDVWIERHGHLRGWRAD